MKFAAALLLAISALAQEVPEIRGTVTEFPTDAPLADAEIILSELIDSKPRVIGRTFTDKSGRFSFRPGHVGEFVVEARKSGYLGTVLAPEEAITLTARDRSSDTALTLVRPGELTGRVVDLMNQPISNLKVNIESDQPRPYFRAAATTDADGVFVAGNLWPDSYRVHITPAAGDTPVAMDFSEAAFQVVEHAVESTYWPGGLPDRADVLPVPVTSGNRVNIGTLKTREVPYYRVRVANFSECSAKEQWWYTLVRGETALLGIQMLDCRQQFLLRNVPPGDVTLAFWNVTQEPAKWGWLPLHVTDHNTSATFAMSPGAEVSGRFLAATGTSLETLGSASIRFQPLIQGLFVAGNSLLEKPANTFTYPNIAWPTQQVSVMPEQPGTYVKEVRYNGAPIGGPLVDLVPSGSLEVVLDSNAAAVTVTVMDSGKLVPASMFLVRWPTGERKIHPESIPPYQYYRRAEDGRVSIANLAPGEYRIIALPPNQQEWRDPAVLQRLLSRAERITLERGSQRSVELKHTDSTR